MAQASQQAIEATRDNSGIVHMRDNGVAATFKSNVPLAADNLVKKRGWVIALETTSSTKLTVYSTFE